MAIDSQNTTRWAFDMNTTDRATATTLGAAFRHDFAAQTIYVPELTRSFDKAQGGRVIVKIVALLTGASAVDLDGIRIGIKINAVAFNDADVTYTLGNTGNMWHIEAWRDVTDYFNTNDPGTASFTCQVGVAFATGSASTVNAIAAELFTTYAYDSAASTYARSAVFPVQSMLGAPDSSGGVTYSEPGCDGTGAAPANQLRKLTGSGGAFENVTGFTLRKRYLVITSMYTSTATTYPNTVRIRFDGGGSVTAWAVCGAQIATTNKNIWILDITSLSGSSAHSFEVSTAVAGTQEHICALDVVTYEYTASSTGQFVSILLPLSAESSYVRLGTSGDADRFSVVFDVPEPSPTMDQSGIVLIDHYVTSGQDTIIAAEGQTARTYDRATTGNRDSFPQIIHRCDHSSSVWAVSHGFNKLYVDVYGAAVAQAAAPLHGYAIINYRCNKHADGAHKHNRSIMACQVMPYTEGISATATPDEPVIPATNYSINGVLIQVGLWHMPQGGHAEVRAKRLVGEVSGKGWDGRTCLSGTGATEVGSNIGYLNFTSFFRANNRSIIGLDIEAERAWNITGPTSALGKTATMWLTYHSCTFTVAGTMQVEGVAVANGKTVKIFAVKSDNSAELVGTTTTTGGTGAFTFEVFDDVRTHFISYVDGATIARSADAVPESGSFSINLGSLNEAVPPVITVVSQPTTPNEPLVVTLYDAVSLLFYHITCKDRPDGNRLSIWDPLDSFAHPFNGKSTKTGSGTSGDPYVFTIYRRGGWPTGLDLDVKVRGVDSSGNQVAS